MNKRHPDKSNCCASTVDYRTIIEDSNPSKTLAVVGRCHACQGIQKVVECAYNIDRIKLAQALHGNSNWFLNSEVVKGLRVKPDKLHGEIASPNIPTPGRSVAEKSVPRDITEPKGEAFEEGDGVF